MTRAVTEVQEAKYKKFMAHPLKDKAVAYLNSIVSAAELDSNDLGVTWGVTLCADTNSVLRVNVSNRYLADVIFKKSHPEGTALMCVIGEPPILGPKSMRVADGFPKIKNSIILTCDLGKDSDRLLSEILVKQALIAHASTSVRNLPNPNWHNPLSVSLIKKPNVDPSALFSETKDPHSKIVKHVSQMLFLISCDDNLDQTEEDLLAEDLDKAAKDLCTSMNINVIEATTEGLKVSIKLVSPISESQNVITSGSSHSPEAQIQEHIAMMLFSLFCDPDESEEQKNELVDEANEIAQMLSESMNIVVTETQNDQTFIISMTLTNPVEFFESIVDET